MNSARILRTIETIRADLAELEAEVKSGAANDAEPTLWLKINDYAKHANVSRDTIYRWLDDGLRAHPGAVVGSGRLTRIHRDLGDAWRVAR